MEKDNIVFIGRKPSMSYVLALATQLASQSEVRIRARGQSISKAVDVVEIIKNKFAQDLEIVDIQIGTDTLQTEKEKINVSRIEIIIRKNN